MLGQATHRRIDHGQAVRLRSEVEAVGGERVDGAHVKQERAFGGVGEHALFAQRHLLDLD